MRAPYRVAMQSSAPLSPVRRDYREHLVDLANRIGECCGRLNEWLDRQSDRRSLCLLAVLPGELLLLGLLTALVLVIVAAFLMDECVRVPRDLWRMAVTVRRWVTSRA